MTTKDWVEIGVGILLAVVSIVGLILRIRRDRARQRETAAGRRERRGARRERTDLVKIVRDVVRDTTSAFRRKLDLETDEDLEISDGEIKPVKPEDLKPFDSESESEPGVKPDDFE